MNTFEQVKAIMVDRLDVDGSKITEETNFIEDLGCDSLDTYELLQGLEESFNITISEDKANDLKTVGKVIEYVDSLKS